MIKDVMTFKEASEIWGLGDSTLRSTIRTNKLTEGIDYWKSGAVWLITKKAMIKVYGLTEEMKKINTKELAKLLKPIKGKTDKENDYIFKSIRYAIQTNNDFIYSEEELMAYCCAVMLDKAKWLNSSNIEDFKNVSDFMNLFFNELPKVNYPIKNIGNKDFEKLVSIIIKMSEVEYE